MKREKSIQLHWLLGETRDAGQKSKRGQPEKNFPHLFIKSGVHSRGRTDKRRGTGKHLRGGSTGKNLSVQTYGKGETKKKRTDLNLSDKSLLT